MNCRFDLDVANAAKNGANVPTDNVFSSNGLENECHGYVWMNPPFGGLNGLVPWLNKFFEHGNGIALTPDRTSTTWFQNAAKRADVMLFISPRVKFERPDGTISKNSASSGTVLFGVGKKAVESLNNARHLGCLVYTNNNN